MLMVSALLTPDSAAGCLALKVKWRAALWGERGAERRQAAVIIAYWVWGPDHCLATLPHLRQLSLVPRLLNSPTRG